MAGGEVVRWEPDLCDNRDLKKPMYMSKNGRYVHYNDWRKERELVNALKEELTRLYFGLEGISDVRIDVTGTTLVLTLDPRTGEV